MVQTAERVINVYKALNVRVGIERKSDRPPERMFEPIPEGPHRGKCLNKDEFYRMLDEYYELHKWEVKTGRPTKRALQDLDLGDVADDLNRMRKAISLRAISASSARNKSRSSTRSDDRYFSAV